MRINKKQFDIIWDSLDKDSETETYVSNDNDLFFIIDGYIVILQTENDFNNVIIKKFKESSMPIPEVFKAIRDAFQELDIQYVRVEGNTKRYKSLKKLFRNVVQDESIVNRNVFYIKVF